MALFDSRKTFLAPADPIAWQNSRVGVNRSLAVIAAGILFLSAVRVALWLAQFTGPLLALSIIFAVLGPVGFLVFLAGKSFFAPDYDSEAEPSFEARHARDVRFWRWFVRIGLALVWLAGAGLAAYLFAHGGLSAWWVGGLLAAAIVASLAVLFVFAMRKPGSLQEEHEAQTWAPR